MVTSEQKKKIRKLQSHLNDEIAVLLENSDFIISFYEKVLERKTKIKFLDKNKIKFYKNKIKLLKKLPPVLNNFLHNLVIFIDNFINSNLFEDSFFELIKDFTKIIKKIENCNETIKEFQIDEVGERNPISKLIKIKVYPLSKNVNHIKDKLNSMAALINDLLKEIVDIEFEYYFNEAVYKLNKLRISGKEKLTTINVGIETRSKSPFKEIKKYLKAKYRKKQTYKKYELETLKNKVEIDFYPTIKKMQLRLLKIIKQIVSRERDLFDKYSFLKNKNTITSYIEFHYKKIPWRGCVMQLFRKIRKGDIIVYFYPDKNLFEFNISSYIMLSKKFSDATIYDTVLHEMIHVLDPHLNEIDLPFIDIRAEGITEMQVFIRSQKFTGDYFDNLDTIEKFAQNKLRYPIHDQRIADSKYGGQIYYMMGWMMWATILLYQLRLKFPEENEFIEIDLFKRADIKKFHKILKKSGYNEYAKYILSFYMHREIKYFLMRYFIISKDRKMWNRNYCILPEKITIDSLIKKGLIPVTFYNLLEKMRKQRIKAA